MIQAFKEIGEIELKGEDKTQKFLSTQAISPEENIKWLEKNDLPDNEIIFNLDTVNKNIEIKLGNELRIDKRKEILAFKQGGAGSKKFFSTNNFSYHIVGKSSYPTIPALIKYIENNFEVKKFRKFLNYLNTLKDTFYVKWSNEKKNNYYLNFNILKDSQKEKFYKLYNKKINNVNKWSNLRKEIEDAWREYLSKEVIGSNRKNDINYYNIFSIKIDNQYIQDSNYGKEYLKVAAYDLLERFFDKKERKKDVLCSVCNQRKKIVTGKIDIQTKFYQYTNTTFFESLSSKNKYKSFSICEGCYQKVCVGISEIFDNFSSSLFRTNYLLIPKNISDNYELEKKIVKHCISLFEGKSIKDELEKLERLIKTIKYKDYKYDFLFYFKDQAAFNVIKHISDVYYKDTIRLFQNLNELKEKEFYNELKYKMNLNSLYWLLFPNKKSHSNPDPSLYRKELIGLLDSILKRKYINYRNLISKFLFIFKKSYFRSDKNLGNIGLNPLRMNILLSFLNLTTNLIGGFNMEKGDSFTDINDKEIKKFFEIHFDIYADSYYRQGLVLLGVLINKIMWEQRGKSSDFFSKLNLDGIPVRRLRKLISKVTEYLSIYNIYERESMLYSEMMDRLQGIEKSNLDKDEVVFYILTGISLGRYIGYKYGKSKSKNETKQEVTNEN